MTPDFEILVIYSCDMTLVSFLKWPYISVYTDPAKGVTYIFYDYGTTGKVLHNARRLDSSSEYFSPPFCNLLTFASVAPLATV